MNSEALDHENVDRCGTVVIPHDRGNQREKMYVDRAWQWKNTVSCLRYIHSATLSCQSSATKSKQAVNTRLYV